MRALSESSIARNWDSFLSYLDRRVRGIQTGIQDIDKYLLGLGGVTVIQGSTSSCKSTLALQIAHLQMAKGHPCLLIDRENGEGRVRARLTCQANNISESDLMVSTIEQRRKLVGPVAKLPMFIYTESVKDQDLLRLRIKEMADMFPGKPMMLLVDSLQAMNPVDDDQRVSLEKWTYFADSLKVEYDGRLTVLLTSEVKRAGYESSDGIGRGKGSNSIEYKAETLLDMRDNPETGLIELQVSKHRDGIKGAKFYLAKQLTNEGNKRSFCFKLKAVQGEMEI